MYGNDTYNVGINLSAGAVGGLALTQNILMAMVMAFAIVAIVTTIKVVTHQRKTCVARVSMVNSEHDHQRTREGGRGRAK